MNPITMLTAKSSAHHLTLLCLLIVLFLTVHPATGQTPTLPDERPAKLEPTNYGFEYVRREVMIPMRDGVKLHTVILIPNGTKNAPILLTRTPYDATGLTTHANSSHLGPILSGYDNATDVIVDGGISRSAVCASKFGLKATT